METKNKGRQEIKEGKKKRKTENKDIKQAPLVLRKIASHVIKLNFPLKYHSIPPY